MTWTGHTLCKICYKQVNFNNKPPSRSQMDSYNKVIATAGASGMSEGDFRASLINNASFAQDDVNALCASPTVRQMMGWA